MSSRGKVCEKEGVILVGNYTEAVYRGCADGKCLGHCLEAAEAAKPLYRSQGLSRAAVSTGKGKKKSIENYKAGWGSQCPPKVPRGPVNSLGLNNRVRTGPTGQGASSSQDWRVCGGLVSLGLLGSQLSTQA